MRRSRTELHDAGGLLARFFGRPSDWVGMQRRAAQPLTLVGSWGQGREQPRKLQIYYPPCLALFGQESVLDGVVSCVPASCGDARRGCMDEV